MRDDDYATRALEIAQSGATPTAMREAFVVLAATIRAEITQEVLKPFNAAAEGEATPAQKTTLTLPEPDPTGKTYPLYKDRPFVSPGARRRITAREHLHNTWQRHIDAGLLTTEALQKLDAELVRALYNQKHYEAQKKGANWKVADLLGTRLDRVAHEDEMFTQAKPDVASLRYVRRQRMRKHRQTMYTDSDHRSDGPTEPAAS